MTYHVTKESRASVQILVDLLRLVNQSPSEFVGDVELRSALRSQGALARYCDERRGVVGSSINTLKRLSDRFVEGGWSVVDMLRRSAVDALEDAEKGGGSPTKSTKAGLKLRIRENEGRIEKLQVANFVLLRAIERLLQDMRELSALADPRARERWYEEALARLRASIGRNLLALDDMDRHDGMTLKRDAD